VNLRLLAQTIRWNRTRTIALFLAGLGWGVLIPVIYSNFSDAVRELANSGAIPRQLLSFGSGNFFSVPGAITIGFQHPLAIAFMGVFGVGTAAASIAAERERGTLEVLLARPISRRTLYVTMAAVVVVLLAMELASLLIGLWAGVLATNISNQIEGPGLWLVFANGLLLWAAIAAFSLAASVSFDRHGPALGLSLAFLLVNYFLEILGSLWTDVAWSQEYSLFHHFQPAELLTGNADLFDFVLLAIAIVIPVVYALVVFPRRDLPAPD